MSKDMSLVPRTEHDPVRRFGYALKTSPWWWYGDGRMATYIIPYFITIVLGCICTGINWWSDHPVKDHTSWAWIALLMLWQAPFLLAAWGAQWWAYRHALPIPSKNVSLAGDKAEDTTAYNSGYNRTIESASAITGGDMAYRAMEPILQEGSAKVHDGMYNALMRYHIAHEPQALMAACKRASLLMEIKNEGQMTRAAEIDIRDETDLALGQDIVAEMKSMRKQLEA